MGSLSIKDCVCVSGCTNMKINAEIKYMNGVMNIIYKYCFFNKCDSCVVEIVFATDAIKLPI